MEQRISSRFEALIESGHSLIGKRGHSSELGRDYWVDEATVSNAQSWLTSAANLVRIVSPTGSYFLEESARLAEHEDLRQGVPWLVVQKVLGLLRSLKEEAEHGLLHRLEYLVAASTFDDFLNHAQEYHKSNKVQESSVLASAVLEDTIKKIAKKNELEPEGKSLEQLIDELAKLGIFAPVKARRIKGFSAVRNAALHAEWERIDIRDVGNLIQGVRELLENFL